MNEFDLVYWIAQVFGLIAFGAYIWSFQLKRKLDLLNWSVIAQIAAVIQYFLLGGISGAITKSLALARSILTIEKERKKWTTPLPLIFLIIAYAGVIVVSIGSWPSVLIAAMTLIHTIIIWRGTTQQIRFFTIVVTAAWVIYDITVGSIFGLCTDGITIMSAMVGIFRYRNKDVRKSAKSKKKPSKKTSNVRGGRE